MVPKLMRCMLPFIDPKNYRVANFFSDRLEFLKYVPVLFAACFGFILIDPYCIRLEVVSICGILKPGYSSVTFSAETTQQAAASLSALKATLSQSPSLLSHSCKMAWLFLPSHKNRGFVSCFLFIYSEAQKLTECLLWMLCVACKVKFGTFPIQSDASQADVSHGGGERACVT